MKISRFSLIFLALIASTGCTDGVMGQLMAVGDSAKIKCYSGEIIIYEGESTGKVHNSQQSDGYFFVDKSDKKLREVSGNCVITYNNY